MHVYIKIYIRYYAVIYPITLNCVPSPTCDFRCVEVKNVI